jgi:hypothetical protein
MVVKQPVEVVWAVASALPRPFASLLVGGLVVMVFADMPRMCVIQRGG